MQQQKRPSEYFRHQILKKFLRQNKNTDLKTLSFVRNESFDGRLHKNDANFSTSPFC